MVCLCCRSDAKTKNEGNSAPFGESMNREGMSEDKEAVERWRQRQNSAGEDSESPLKHTYDITKQPPLQPKDGSILNQAPPGKNSDISSSPEKSAFQRLEPKVQRSGLLLTLSQDEKDDPDQSEKIISIVSKEDKSMDSYVESSSMKELAGQVQRSPRGSEKDKSGIVAISTLEKDTEDATTSDPFACFVGPSMLGTATAEAMFLGSPGTGTLASGGVDDSGDHLSDVGSDVDPEARDRYLQACKVLKARLMNKGKTLDPNERDLILSLLNDAEAVDVDAGSVISAEQISVLENAAFRLQSTTASRFSETETDDSTTEEVTRSMGEDHTTSLSREIPKYPHTATPTRAKKSKFSMPSVCGPKSMKEIEMPADIILLVKEENDFEEPALVEEYPPVQEGEMARADGWSDFRSMEFPFRIIGADNERRLHPRVMTPPMMEALRGFLPYKVTESNFWLKFSLVRDGASLATLLATIKASTYTFIGVETNHGEVFGAFTGTAWRSGSKWFGNGESFLWRLKQSRLASQQQSAEGDSQNEMEVYPYTAYDTCVQYCTSKTIAVGGGDWYDHDCPFVNEPKGIGFMVDGDLAGGETNSCATFANPRLCKKTSLSNEFVIENLEVWTLTPFDNENDAAQLEMQKLFLEQNARKGLV